MDTKQATENTDTVKTDRLDDARVLVVAVRAALEEHERVTREYLKQQERALLSRIGRARELLSELEGWANSGKRSRIAERFIEIRSMPNEDDLRADEICSAAFHSALELGLAWAVGEDTSCDLESAVDELVSGIAQQSTVLECASLEAMQKAGHESVLAAVANALEPHVANDNAIAELLRHG